MNNIPLSSWTVNQRGMRVTIILDHPGQSTDFRICRFLENGYSTGDTIAVAPDKRLALIVANCLNLHDDLVKALGEAFDIIETDHDGQMHEEPMASMSALLAKAKGEANVD